MSSADKLIIETPEQTSLEFPLAGIGSRFLALALDTLLLWGGVAVVAIIVGVIGFEAGKLFRGSGTWFFGGLLFVVFVLQFGYFAIFETIWNGQTPGKRWTHLRVIKDSGRPIGPNEAILRNLLRIVDTLPTLYATGIVCALISRENKRVGDYAAGTVVVHEKPIEGGWSAEINATPSQKPLPLASVRLTIEELQLIESFLDRRHSLAPDVRWSIAHQLSDRFAQQLKIPPEDRPDSEIFLETLAEQGRTTARFR